LQLHQLLRSIRQDLLEQSSQLLLKASNLDTTNVMILQRFQLLPLSSEDQCLQRHDLLQQDLRVRTHLRHLLFWKVPSQLLLARCL
jgi:hypothetical protein